MRIIFLLVIVPIVELFLLLEVKDATSWSFTILLTLVTGVVGAGLARWQGWSTIRKIQEEMAKGALPATSIVDAVMIFAAGLLLMTPGILTDVFGFTLLVPFMRIAYRKLAMNWIRKNVRVETFSTQEFATSQDSHDQIIDSHVVDAPAKDPNENLG